MSEKQIIAISLGDPCGIGPEVVAKALATGAPHAVCRPLVIGSAAALQQGADIAGVNLNIRCVAEPSAANDAPGCVDVFDSGALDPAEIELGVAKATCGRANSVWLEEAAAFAMAGRVAGNVMAPVNGEALAKGGAKGGLPGTQPDALYLTLISGPLRIVHVFDHVPLETVCRDLSSDLVLGAIRRTHTSLIQWGMPNPRIGVAGLNPHAHGRQEREAIDPAVRAAIAQGVDVEGPVAPDTVFRRCIEDRYDVVVAMFHDQGHIAVKTWGFVGNCALFLGAPYLFLSVGHGTAFDIAGRGIAKHEMMLTAILQAASLAAGRGFHRQ